MDTPRPLKLYRRRFLVLLATCLANLNNAIVWSTFAAVTPSTAAHYGTTIAALSNPFSLCAPTKVAAKWFGENERLTANTAMSLATFVGSAFVLPFSSWIVQEEPDKIPTLNFISFAIIAVLAMPSLFVTNEPPTPPSVAAEEVTMPFWDGLRSLQHNTQFVLLFFIAGLSMGTFEVYITLISDSIVPYGYMEADAGTLGLISIVSGILASLFLARILDHSKSHRAALRLLPGLALVGFIGFSVSAVSTDNRVWLYVSAAVIGIGCFPILPITLEIGAEIARPVAEGTSGGVLETSIQLCAIAVLLGANALRTDDGKLGDALFGFVGVIGVVAFLILFLEGADAKGTEEESERLLRNDEEGQ
ncbi:hypothetical protein HDU98_008344 [Podochytrium sp. JEL0797]|nr:hypothetical protein HDU98_008344 [Podochytrium sp. JEL0797]